MIHVPSHKYLTFRRLLVVPEGTLVAGTARRRMFALTDSGVAGGLRARKGAAAPATCAEAIAVPDISAHRPPSLTDSTASPGARMSTVGPQLEKEDAKPFCRVVAPTVIAPGACAGENVEASSASLPADTTNTTPSSTAAAMAWSS